MTQEHVYLSVFLMGLFTYLLRVLPLTLIRRPIRNRFARSFLYYTPYVTLSVMTCPAIVYATQTPWSGLAALAVGVLVAWFGGKLFHAVVACFAVVFIIELFL